MPTYDTRALLENLIDRADAKIRERFGEIILRMKREHSLEVLAAMVTEGRIEDALSLLGSVAERLATVTQAVWIGAGSEVAEAMSDALGVEVAFDVTNYGALQQMSANRIELVREFTAQQRAATREALLEAMRGGVNPREAARAFRDSIGLTQQQVQWVNNYRRLLEQNSAEALTRELRDARFDSTVRSAIATERPLTRTQINRMVERYQERALKYRSEVIARTEALRNVHQGSDEAIRQAIESGRVNADGVSRTWQTAKDERVRSFERGDETSHASMHGQQQPAGSPFVSGAGNFLMHPGDPDAPPYETIQCRCVVATRVTA